VSKPSDYDIAEAGRMSLGRSRVEWAGRRMPVLSSVHERFAASRPFASVRIGASLHVTAETAVLLAALKAGGAELSVCASNPLSTNDDVAAFLVSQEIPTFARRGEDPERYQRHVDAVLDRRPAITVDDGCDLVARVHLSRPAQVREIEGGTEDTSTGALRLRALAANGALGYPVLALSGAPTRTLADNRHGTGQSTVDGIMRATNILFAGSTVVVAGYGNCGRAVAERARGLGAIVIVTEVEPLRALEAAMDGFSVMPMVKAAPIGDIFVTATGNRDVLVEAHFEMMRDGAILANAGQFDVEIDVRALEAHCSEHRRLRPMVDEYVMGSRRILLLAEGRLVNLGAADGHPPQVMDLSFSLQALACEWLVVHAGELPAGVHEPPAGVDDEIARLKLLAMGVRLDELSEEQSKYLAAWGDA
jgi:adenosylhomocysteinase